MKRIIITLKSFKIFQTKVLLLLLFFNFGNTYGQQCEAPSAQATFTVFGSETSSTLNLFSFIAPAGGADGYAIYLSDTNSFTTPVDGVEPTPDSSWNMTSQQAVYFGTSTSPNITVTDLDPATKYFFQVYAYKDCNGTETYENIGLNADDTTALGVLTISSISVNDKVYDGATAADVSGNATLLGLVSGDVVTLGGSPVFTFASANVGTGITVNTSGYTIEGTDAGKYILTQPTFSANITRAALTVAPNSRLSKVYGSSDPTLTYTISGFQGSDTEASLDIGVTISREIGENVDTYLVTPSDAADSNYNIIFVVSNFAITQAALTVTANSGLSKVYGTFTDPILTYTISGFQGSDNETSLDNRVAISRVAGENVGNYLITPSGAVDSNYNIIFVESSFFITPAILTVTANSGLSKVYGSNDLNLTYTISGFEGPDTEASLDIGVTISREVGENVGDYLVTPYGAVDSNYNIRYEKSSFFITPANLIVTAKSGLSKVYGTILDPNLTYTISGFLGSDTEANLDSGVTISRVVGENVGDYLITPYGAVDSNYNILYEKSSFTIKPAVLTVTADSGLSKVYGATDPDFTYTISGFEGPDNEASLDIGVTISRAVGENVDTYLITPSGAADSNYNIIFVESNFDITPAALTVTADSGLSKVYGAFDPILTYTISGFLGSDTEASLDTLVTISREEGENVDTYLITPSASGAADSNYSIIYVTSRFAITPAALTVTADSGLSKVYGAIDPTLTYTISGFQELDTEGSLDTGVTISREEGENVGNYVITPSSAADSNYSISYVESSFFITPAALTVRANSGLSKVYGATDPTLTYAISGFQGSDTEGSLDTPVIISRVAGENVGDYLITPSGAADSNYSISYVTSIFAITPTVLTVTANSGLSKAYGATDPTLTYTISGFIGSDTEASLDTRVKISRVAGENVGNYLITPSGAMDSKYSIIFVTSTFAITPAALAVTADSGFSKVYGTSLDPILTYTISGFIGSDNEATLDRPVIISRAAGENAGTYVITPSGAAKTNYTINFVTSTFIITPVALTVTANSGYSKTYGATDPTLTYTVSGFIGPDNEATLDRPVIISRGAGENVGNYVLTPSGAVDSNYSISFVTSTFAITPAALTVTADSGLSKVYGATDPNFTYIVTGLVNGDIVSDLDIAVTISRAVGENVGNYVLTQSGAVDSNYSIIFVTSTFAITPAALSVTANSGLSKPYGSIDPTLTYTISGFQGSDTEASLDTGVTISRAAGENLDTYLVTPSGAVDSNYNISFVTSRFAITPAILTVIADSGLSKVYGATDPTLSYTITGFVNGDVETDLDTGVSISRVVGKNVGTYVITPSGAAETNYTVSFVTSTFVITPVNLMVSGLEGDDKVYDGTTLVGVSGTPVLSGVLSNDNVTLEGSPVYEFTSLKLGNNIAITTSGFIITGPDSGNYTLIQPTLSANIVTTLKLFPNPAVNFIKISGLTEKADYVIYNALGKKVAKGEVFNKENISIQSLTTGRLYFIKIDNHRAIKFIKK